MEKGGLGKSKFHSLGSGGGWGQGHHALDLEKGEGYPSPQFLSLEMETEEDPLPSISQPFLPSSAWE